MIRAALPPAVHVAEAFDDDEPAELYAEELAVIARAVGKRRTEFATVRRCARAALAELGTAPAPLLPGERGAPVWPAGVVGSMTHCAGYRAAAVARVGDLRSIGIDAEPDAPLPAGVLDAITVPGEQDTLAALPRGTVHWDRLLFSAKESVYKAWFPLARRFLDFGQARVVVRADGTFTAELLVAGPVLRGRELTGFDGSWVAGSGLVATAVTVPDLIGRPGFRGPAGRVPRMGE